MNIMGRAECIDTVVIGGGQAVLYEPCPAAVFVSEPATHGFCFDVFGGLWWSSVGALTCGRAFGR